MKEKTKTGAKTPQQKRRHVRLDIFSPVEFHVLIVENDHRVRSHPAKKAGILLNLSGGGALISSTDEVTGGDLVLMRFDIKGMETMSEVVGKVKRVEQCEDGEYLIGAEFLTADLIEDPKLADALARLSGDPLAFTDTLKRVVSRFVFQRQIDAEMDTQ
jgi:c-di-GMP-binding flagellar brake protein YcgR